MMWMLEDRRQRRSSDRQTALRYQLDHIRDRGRIEALVVVDDQGIVVASSGEDGVCEELGAVAPLMSRSPLGMPLSPLLTGGEVAVRPLELQGQRLFLACLGGNVARDALLGHPVKGVARILGAN